MSFLRVDAVAGCATKLIVPSKVGGAGGDEGDLVSKTPRTPCVRIHSSASQRARDSPSANHSISTFSVQKVPFLNSSKLITFFPASPT